MHPYMMNLYPQKAENQEVETHKIKEAWAYQTSLLRRLQVRPFPMQLHQ